MFQVCSKKFARMGKRKIAENFFKHKIGKVNWNFNAPIKKPNKKTRVHHAYLVRICSMIKFISIPTLRPHVTELRNPFVFFEVKKQ